MSYDIYLIDKTTKKIINLEQPHHMKGGTYALGGTTEAHLNVTYNYWEHFHRVFGEEGIRSLYGMSGGDSIPILCGAIDNLKDDVSENYWDSTEGNARQSLLHLLELATLCPEGIWDGD